MKLSEALACCHDDSRPPAIQDITEAILMEGLIADAYDRLSLTEHRYDCPRGRDDYDCTCGLQDILDRLEEYGNR